MVLPINTLVKVRESGKVFRVLDEVKSRETKDLTSTHYVLIDIGNEKALPCFEGKLKVLDRLGLGELVVVSDTVEPVDLELLSDYDADLVSRRWRLVQFAAKYRQSLWDKQFRGRLARRLAYFGVASKPHFYGVMRLYWQKGQTKEAIATDMWRCGAPGVARIPVEGAPKPGRKRTIQPGTGVAMTQEHRRNMSVAWASAAVGRDGRFLRRAWEWMLITRYSEHVELNPKKSDDSSKEETHRVVVQNYDAVPTFEQFEYHWMQENPFSIRKLKRLGPRKFDLAYKPLLTGTLQEVRGPGTRYYVDATVLDVYVVSRLNRRRIVGRPTLYVVIDQFSRMVVGIYVGLEPPSWGGAMLALWHCSVDKVEYCREWGIEITSDMWPTGYMPVHFMGDRGEMKSADADRLSAGFGFDVENAPPYKGEAKGIVERMFKTLHAIFGPFMPGYIDKELASRDAEPAVLRSAMTLEMVIRSVINAVLISNTHVVREYEGWPEVIADGVPFVPTQLWQWGAENLRCDSRRFSDLHLKRYLWPQAEMKTTRRGLQLYRGLYYMGDAMRQQSWFAEALHRRTSVRTVFHPSVTNSATALPLDAHGAACELTLVRRSQRLGGVSFSELAALELQKKHQNAAAAWSTLPIALGAYSRILNDARSERQQAAAEKLPGETRAERTRDIRGNREAELESMTHEVVQDMSSSNPDTDAPPPQVQLSEPDEAVGRTAEHTRRILEARRRPQSPPLPSESKP